jgi:hypothetical protein
VGTTQLDRLEALERRRDALWDFCRAQGGVDDWAELERASLTLVEAIVAIDLSSLDEWLMSPVARDVMATSEE